jgi:hypothetical protein
MDKGDMTTATRFDPVRPRYDDKHSFSLWLDGSTSRKRTTKAKLAGLIQYGEHAPT